MLQYRAGRQLAHVDIFAPAVLRSFAHVSHFMNSWRAASDATSIRRSTIGDSGELVLGLYGVDISVFSRQYAEGGKASELALSWPERTRAATSASREGNSHGSSGKHTRPKLATILDQQVHTVCKARTTVRYNANDSKMVMCQVEPSLYFTSRRGKLERMIQR